MQTGDFIKKLKEKDYAPIIFYVMLFLFILAYSLSGRAYDYDLWARLIVGKYVLQTGHLPMQDFLSFTPTHTWYDHEWGSSIIFYLTQHYFSYVGLLMLQVIVVFMTFFTISKTIKLKGVTTTTPYNFLFYLFGILSVTQIFDQLIRCQIFTFLFFAIFLYILELARTGKTKPLYLLPFIMLFWNNMHGGCVAGIGLIFIYILGEFINRKPIKEYLLPLILTLAVLPINPWGFEYLKFLFTAATMPRPLIYEWLGLFHKEWINYFFEFKFFVFGLILFEIIYMIKSVYSKTFKFDATKFLVIITTLYLTIAHIKHVPFVVIAVSVFLYDDFYTLFNQLTNNIFDRIKKEKNFIVYALISVFIFINIQNKNFTPAVETVKYPLTIVEFIKINHIKGNIVTKFGHGSFVSYKLYPQNKIYMDGRYEEVYPDIVLYYLQTFITGSIGWKDLINSFHPDLLLVEKSAGIYPILKKNPEWVQIFEDSSNGLFIKKDKAKKKYKKPPTDLEYYKKTIFDTNIDFRK